MTKNGKFCERKVNQIEKIYQCFVRNCIMHLETSCTRLSNVATNRTKELRLACMLIFNTCIENNQRDNIIQNWTIHKANEQVKYLKFEDKLESLKKKLITLLKEKMKKSWKCPVKISKQLAKQRQKIWEQILHRNPYRNWTRSKSWTKASHQVSEFRWSLRILNRWNTEILSQWTKRWRYLTKLVSTQKSKSWEDLERLKKAKIGPRLSLLPST